MRLDALRIDADDPVRLAAFWAGLLGRTTTDDGLELVPADDTGLRIRFRPATAPRTGLNQMHPELTSGSWEGQRGTVARALALGGRHLDVGQLPEEEHVVLADPEGNELCVLEPTNTFLAGCGLLGGLSCDGTRQVGCFWSEALGWPLVWDQDEETAVQSPRGGPKLAWGGPPLNPRSGPSRLSFDLRTDDPEAEAARLVSLGATRLREDALADPDGNPFRLLHGEPLRA